MKTIFALSSGRPPAGIAVIRISGSAAAKTARLLTQKSLPDSRRAVLRNLYDPDTNEQLDQALVIWFPAPKTVTGEDLLELHVHGGRAVVDAVLSVLEKQPDLRPAEAGEFTRRAFLNGIISLHEAEGLGDLLSAETASQRRAALMMSGGALGRQIASWQDRLLTISGQIEAGFDFSEDIEEDENESRQYLEAIREKIAILIAEHRAFEQRPTMERLRDGLRVVLAGRPNAGKSTLINALTGQDIAITAPIAGTTRDVIEVSFALKGIPMRFSDTAGLHESDDILEQAGIIRARKAIAEADILLWLGDADDAPDTEGEVLVLYPQIDLPDRLPIPEKIDIALSAKTGQGVDLLQEKLVELGKKALPKEDEVTLNRRQHRLVKDAADSLSLVMEAEDMLIVAEAVRQACRCYDQLTGKAGVENMLDNLFSRFCIGK
ncbi:MAG: tRNA uridine-5-carboxymethylaminomethyl(34) synthesis GTPase MnmE [Zymomonas mobilis]|uniref:tRNA modification GTPase MnmE n=1 Tax=Zymomonas mobilis TaxID=542 RepID=A0A542VZ11_ZYMMB|nr:tRNA uridine-5-carboxymethylaminomethyl(34) synthesis GTPase MnmE [Zymomonas mobilis]TQL16564.1 tRNA modification GTPase trmE [Zymomonas mobilis]